MLYIIYTVKVNVADSRSRTSTEIRVSYPRHFSLNDPEGEDNIESKQKGPFQGED